MKQMIHADNIIYRYEGEIAMPAVLDQLTVNIGEGEFVAVLGHNGSGKSTLAKHFNAILIPESGDVLAVGINTRQLDRLMEIRRNVGMVFQNPDNQIVSTVVEEDVAFALENVGMEPAEIRRRVDEALRNVGMTEFANHSPSQLSGGQKQRIAIAGIIAMRPKCIVLDEPTAMLDPAGRTEVLRTIRRLNREYGITVIMITHYMEEAAEFDRVIVMDDGRILLDGTPKQVFSHVSLLESVGLDVPQTTQLCFDLNQLGWTLPDDLLTEEECAEEIIKYLKEHHVCLQ